MARKPDKLDRGLLIAIEGIDGAGKTTQARLLAERLESCGLDVVRTKEPTDGPHGTRIRESAVRGRLAPQDELDAFVEDRKQHVAEVIAPALQRGLVVIVDRYYFSTAAYQGARGLDFAEILKLNERFAPKPDLLVLIDVPPPVGVARVQHRGDRPNLFEETAYLERCATLFGRIQVGDRVVRLDGRQDETTVHKQILRHLRPILAAHSAELRSVFSNVIGG